MPVLLSFLLALAVPSPSFAGAGAGAISGRVVIVKNGATLADLSNCVVWVEGAHRPPAASPTPATVSAAHVEMKSQGKKFVPRVVAVEKNAEVAFPNVDPIYHNVFSVSPTNRFDLGLYRSGGSKAKKFDEPGVVRVYCNIHPQMVGFVLVVDSDFTTVTGADGAFRFENVPAGNWQLRAWQEEAGDGQLPVTVRARAASGSGAESPVTLRLDATEYKAQPHKNKYGKDYPPNAGTDDERY